MHHRAGCRRGASPARSQRVRIAGRIVTPLQAVVYPDVARIAMMGFTFAPPVIGEEEIQEVIDTLRSPWITTGPKTRRFEQEFAAYCGAAHCVTVGNGLDALAIALKAHRALSSAVSAPVTRYRKGPAFRSTGRPERMPVQALRP